MTAPLTQSEQAQLHLKLGRAMLAEGRTVASSYIGEHGVTIIANRFSAARWRQEFGSTFHGAPLHVFEAIPVEALAEVSLG